jgi:sugar lactone lactonase YvrE
MYFSDSNRAVRTIWACDYDTVTGTPGEPRVFFDTRQVKGRPDGGTVDAEGCYWQAGIEGWALYRISPEGELMMTVDVPVEKPTKPMFGGPDLDILYFTSLSSGLDPARPQPEAGSLHAVTGLGIKGFPQTRFAA